MSRSSICFKWNQLHGSWTYSSQYKLTHLGRMAHICVSKQTTIGSDNGLSQVGAKPLSEQCWNILDLRNALQWNRMRNLYTFIQIQENASQMSPVKSRSFCLGLNVLNEKSRLYMCPISHTLCTCYEVCMYWLILLISFRNTPLPLEQFIWPNTRAAS